MGKFFTEDDLVMNGMDIVMLPIEKIVQQSEQGRQYTIHPRNLAYIPCEEVDADVVRVGSQSSVGEWHSLIHDGKKVVYCSCKFAEHHDGWCPNHRERAQMALDKRTTRLSQGKEQAVTEQKTITVQVEVEQGVLPEPKKEDTHRTDAPLARPQGFNLMR